VVFFNRKEEVIDIELTQYGKQLLSMGKFKPAYYQFFDDDVIYDNQYAGSTDELQRDIQTRIKESPRTHVQYTFVSPEGELKKAVEQVRNKRKGSFSDVYVPYNLKHRVMSSPLANAEIGEQRKPAWNIQSLKGQFSDTKTYVTGTYANLKTPRLTLADVEFKIATTTKSSDNAYTPGNNASTLSKMGINSISDLNNLSTMFKDGSAIQVQEDYILLDLQEMNSQFLQENFEVQLYEVTTDANGEEELKQLYFNKKTENVVNNLLVDSNQNITNFQTNQTDMAETYFIVQADREINSKVLCRDLSMPVKQTLVATNQLDLQCEELYGTLTDPRIQSDVKPEDLVENC
jgi:hypothetical protein